MRLDVKPASALSDAERGALKALTAAVYPPEVIAASPGRYLTWAPPQYSVRVFTEDGELVSHVGIVVREGTLDGAPVAIGGIRSVKTHPRFTGRGFASAGLRHAAALLDREHGVAFSLLVCQAHLLPFYERFGWIVFDGRLLVEQPQGRVPFTVNQPMVLTGRGPAPRAGTIDLAGPPW